MCTIRDIAQSKFLSTPSARRATKGAETPLPQRVDFYPRPPRGGRLLLLTKQTCFEENFYPRPPRGGRLQCRGTVTTPMRFLSTPSARRATEMQGNIGQLGKISIHALREEGDFSSRSSSPGWMQISIHALREEGDCDFFAKLFWTKDFYPRPPRGGRPLAWRIGGLMV